jgi:hypothetical protein
MRRPTGSQSNVFPAAVAGGPEPSAGGSQRLATQWSLPKASTDNSRPCAHQRDHSRTDHLLVDIAAWRRLPTDGRCFLRPAYGREIPVRGTCQLSTP